MLEIQPGHDIINETISFHFTKVKDWNILVEMNVVYLCIQKHKYIPKKI